MEAAAILERFKKQFDAWEKTLEQFSKPYLATKNVNNFTTTLRNFHLKE